MASRMHPTESITRAARILRLAVFALACGGVTTGMHAADAGLIGIWDGDDRAAEAIYRTLTITPTHIAWPRTNNLDACKAAYKVVLTHTGPTYPDVDPVIGNDAQGRTFSTTKLQIEPSACTGRVGALQFALPSDAAGYAYVVEYDPAGRPVGWIHFRRRN